MGEMGDREKIRRAYFKARDLKLAESIQTRLSNALKPKKKQIEDKVPIPPQEPPQKPPTPKTEDDTKLNTWIQMLSAQNSRDQAVDFFLKHAQTLTQEFSKIKSDTDFYSLICLIPDSKTLLMQSAFGRRIVGSKNNDDRFKRLNEFLETRIGEFSREDVFVISLIFSDPLQWFTKDDKVWKQLGVWVVEHYQELSSMLSISPLEFPLDFFKEKGLLELEFHCLYTLSNTRRLNAKNIERLRALSEILQETSLLSNLKLLKTLRNEDKNPLNNAAELLYKFQKNVSLDSKLSSRCTSDFSIAEKKFVTSYIRIVPWILYFHYKDSGDFRIFKQREWILDASIRKCYSVYKKLDFKFPKTLVHLGLYSPRLLGEVPSFFKNLPDNNFGKTLANLTSILGLNHIETLLPKIREWSSSSKIHSIANQEFRQWLERADKDIKLNWHQLQSSQICDEKEKAHALLCTFALRFTSLLCRDGMSFIWDLKEVEQDQNLIRDLEAWMLRDI